MRPLLRILLVLALVLFLAIPLAILIYRADPILLTADNAEFIFLALFFIPVLAAFVGVLVIAAHPKTYHFSPITEFEGHDGIDPLVHSAVGAVEAITNDLSSGFIANPSLYIPQMFSLMDQELRAFAPYRERGYELNYQFYHNLEYGVHVVEMIERNDVIVEISGIFDYFVERAGVRRLTPHDYDRREPYVQQPAIVRVRLQAPSGNIWHVAGFSDSLLELQIGYPTI